MAPLLLVLAFVLAACSATPPSTWGGGLVGVWEPPAGVEPKQNPIILHQGHDCFAGCQYPQASLRPIAERFAQEGYVVYGLEMPPEPHDHGPMTRFTGAALSLLDALDAKAFMIGLSGGGLVTTLVTAESDKVLRGYSVAGDAPLEVFISYGYDPDWEYRAVADYRELYRRVGARLVHIYNFNEGGALSGPLGDLGYPYVTDYYAVTHQISEWAVQYILEDMARYDGPVVSVQ